MNQEVMTIGETMVIFDPVYQGPLRYVQQFQKRFGGAESNVAIGLARLGHRSGWISRVGADELGDYVINAIRGEGVDTSAVIRTEEAPTGMYVKERVRKGTTQVYYYRHGSAASQMSLDDIDWGKLKSAQYLHLTGITPFLSSSCHELTMEAVNFAEKNGVPFSFDPNLRHKLLKAFPDHKETLRYFASKADLFMPGLDEAEYLFGKTDVDKLLDDCLLNGSRRVVIKDGSSGTYYADHYHRGFIESLQVDYVEDPIGAGDGFAAGVLSGILDEETLENAVRRGSVIGAMVITVGGDVEGLPTRKEMAAFEASSTDVER